MSRSWTRFVLPLAALALATGPGTRSLQGQSPPVVPMKKLTPIITVESVEPCLPFWTERLGFALTAQVPEGDHMGFAMLQHGAVEVMYQTRSSMAADAPQLAAAQVGERNLLFIEVADVEDVARRLEGVEVVVPMRTTFYGAKELFVRAPCGSIVGFAEFAAEGGAGSP